MDVTGARGGYTGLPQILAMQRIAETVRSQPTTPVEPTAEPVGTPAIDGAAAGTDVYL